MPQSPPLPLWKCGFPPFPLPMMCTMLWIYQMWIPTISTPHDVHNVVDISACVLQHAICGARVLFLSPHKSDFDPYSRYMSSRRCLGDTTHITNHPNAHISNQINPSTNQFESNQITSSRTITTTASVALHKSFHISAIPIYDPTQTKRYIPAQRRHRAHTYNATAAASTRMQQPVAT